MTTTDKAPAKSEPAGEQLFFARQANKCEPVHTPEVDPNDEQAFFTAVGRGDSVQKAPELAEAL